MRTPLLKSAHHARRFSPRVIDPVPRTPTV